MVLIAAFARLYRFQNLTNLAYHPSLNGVVVQIRLCLKRGRLREHVMKNALVSIMAGLTVVLVMVTLKNYQSESGIDYSRPTYLDCLISQVNGKQKAFAVTLDKKNGTVMLTTKNNDGVLESLMLKGFYKPYELVFEKIEDGGYTTQYRINRVDLSAERAFWLGDNYDKDLMTGKCKIVNITQRKF
jgi:hypothetical protein